MRQQIIDFTYDDETQKTLIYDNALQFTSIDFSDYGITGVNISSASSNMISYVERLNGAIRRGSVGPFPSFSEKQVRNIFLEYVEYFNTLRPHQGIDKIPDAEIQKSSGTVKKIKILSELHHHYFRSSA